MRIKSLSVAPEPPFGRIPLGGSNFCIVDIEDLPYLKQFRWFLKKSSSRWYAVRKVQHKNKIRYIRMHRELMHTKGLFVCHHKNGNSLDNRKKNLENMLRGLHDMVHWKA